MLRAVVLALTTPKGNAAASSSAAELLLEQELKFDCEDCCNVARTSLHLMRSRENNGANNTSDTEADHAVKVSLF